VPPWRLPLDERGPRLSFVEVPTVRYARSGDVAIAYAILGDGPIDLVFVHGFAGNLDFELESPYWRPFHDRLASFSRHVMFDRRGTGLSDRMREAPTLETRMDGPPRRARRDRVGERGPRCGPRTSPPVDLQGCSIPAAPMA
jgi:pimeloyl-ACP methyl ester carboxylesterase